MIGIKVNGHFLDLKPGASTEIERKSPFFAVEDIASEATTAALEFAYTPANAVALGLPYQYYTLRSKKKFEAEHYDGNTFRGRCTLVIETAHLDINNIEAATISGYILYGISHFFQDIKGKKLSELRLGGVRSFDWTTNNPTDGSNGFWQHVHNTWTDATIPYVFAPVRNETWWNGIEGVDWMNGLGDDGKIKYSFFDNPLVPMIRVKYLIEQIFAEAGWQISFTGLNDTDWQKLLLVSTKDIDWYEIGFAYGPISGTTKTYTPRATVKYWLYKHLPPNKTISDFLIQLFYKYGWMPVFNLQNKKCRLVASKELRNGRVKDWTGYASSAIESAFNQDAKIYAYVNEIDSNDTLPSAPDFTAAKFGVSVGTVRSLPTPTADQEGTIVYCVFENKWLKATYNTDTLVYEWVLFADNIYSLETDGATYTITTTISTLPIYFTKYRTASSVDYYGFFPTMKEDKTKDFGYRTLLYHGVVPELTAAANAGLITYPYASSILFDSVGNVGTAWSDVLSHKINAGFPNEVDKGTVAYWLKTLVDIIQYGEDMQLNLYLPLIELYRFEWDDIILIRNVPFLVKSLVEPLPNTGLIQATLKRLVNPETQTTVVVAPVSIPFFAHIAIVNIRDDYSGTGPYGGWTSYKSCDVLVTLFSNIGGTTPFVPTTAGVNVLQTGTLLINGTPAGPPGQTWQNITESSQYVSTRIMYSGNSATSGDAWSISIALAADPNGIYTVI